MVARENAQNQKNYIYKVKGVVTGHSQHKPAVSSSEVWVSGCYILIEKSHNSLKHGGSWVVLSLILNVEEIREVVG